MNKRFGGESRETKHLLSIFLSILISVILLWGILLTPALGMESWLTGLSGEERGIDQKELVAQIETFALPLYYFEQYTNAVFTEIGEPGHYRVSTTPEVDTYFQIEGLNRVEDISEEYRIEDTLVWKFADPERGVELILFHRDTEKDIDLRNESSFIFTRNGHNLEGSIRFLHEDEYESIELPGERNLIRPGDRAEINAEYTNVREDIPGIQLAFERDFSKRETGKLSFAGLLAMPGMEAEGEYLFKFTDRPQILPREQKIYLNEIIFTGYLETPEFVIEGNLWICLNSIVLDGYLVR